MRLVPLAAAAVAAFMLAATPAAACCGGGYGVAPVVPAVPPDALDPWYPVRQIYVVNQGPVFTGPGIYAYSNFYVPPIAPPLCCRVGYVQPYYPYAPPFPYVRGRFGCHGGVERCWYGGYGYRGHWRGRYAAYHHGPPPSARFIRPRPYGY